MAAASRRTCWCSSDSIRDGISSATGAPHCSSEPHTAQNMRWGNALNCLSRSAFLPKNLHINPALICILYFYIKPYKSFSPSIGSLRPANDSQEALDAQPGGTARRLHRQPGRRVPGSLIVRAAHVRARGGRGGAGAAVPAAASTKRVCIADASVQLWNRAAVYAGIGHHGCVS